MRFAMRASRAFARAVLTTALLVGAAACDDADDFTSLEPEPPPPPPPTVADIVGTIRDTTYNFGAARTFSIVDSIVHFVPPNGTPLAVSRAYDDAIVASIRE